MELRLLEAVEYEASVFAVFATVVTSIRRPAIRYVVFRKAKEGEEDFGSARRRRER